MERRKVKNGEKSPWGQCLTRPVPTVAAVLASDWCQKTQDGGKLEDFYYNLKPAISS